MRRQPLKRRPHKKPRFYCDENFFPFCIPTLSKFDVKHAVLDFNFGGREDKFHFQFTAHEEKILLTLDTDYLNDAKYKLNETFGVVIISVSPPVVVEKINKVLFGLKGLFSLIDYDGLKHAKIFATLDGWKIWYLENGKKLTEQHNW